MSLRHDEAIVRAALLTVHEVHIRLDLTRDEDFTSSTTITFDCARPGAQTFVDFAGTSLDRVELNGQRLTGPQWDGRRLTLDGLQRHNTLTVSGTMAYSSDGEGLHRSVDAAEGERYLYAMSFLDAAPRWFACFDQPDLKARHRLDVAAPPGWLVRGNAPMQQVEGQWRSEPTAPISSYLVTVVAGPWVELTRRHRAANGDMTLGLLARRGLAEELRRDADDLFTVTAACLTAYEDLFAVPYAFGDYLQVFAPDFNAGAMENPGCVVLREQFLHRGHITEQERASRAGTIAHELAHQWFGDLVTMRWWDDLWLNESFAEYLGHRICTEHTRYPLWAQFGLRRKTWGLSADQGPNTHPVAGNGAEDTTAALANFDGISYAKGAAVLRQLAAWMGDEAFFAGLRHHVQGHAHGNATMADLVAAWQAQGVDGLQLWLQRWLTTSGADRLRVAEGPLRLEREGTRPHALRVAVHAPDGSLRDQASLVCDLPTVPLDVRAEPGDLVLPDADDTAWAMVRPAVAGGEVTDFALQVLPDPQRASLLGNLHDAVQDAQADPGRVLQLLLRALPDEIDPTLLGAELDLARICSSTWCPPRHRAARRAALAQTCRELLAAAEPGSDRHLEVLRTLVASSDDPALLHALLEADGATSLGPEDRWAAVRRLVALGEDPRLVDAEQDRDPSSTGRLHALTARAAVPATQAKRAALRRVLTDAQASAYEIQAIARGLFLPEQDQLVAGLAVEWLGGINATAARRQGWGLTGTVRAGFPSGFADDEVRQAARRALQDPHLDRTVERALRDGCFALDCQAASWERYPG
ncbi:aminopeptidase N [Luteococcus sp. OSA5]|uniref:aminopeptidase N n=1 Tax=Luteococcus sp. OSA5 TaxID=3401630 RepID=UPI003B4282E5